MHDERPRLDPLVGVYYERVPEESRLDLGAFRLEEARTRELVVRHAPPPPARVLDVGGAAGASAFWLAERGYDVSLVGAAPRLVSVARDLVDGQHRNPTDRDEYFTTSYFHRPEELRDEVGAADLTVDALYGIEGPGWMLRDFMERWNDEPGREGLLRVARMCESEPAMIGCSAHLLAVATKR